MDDKKLPGNFKLPDNLSEEQKNRIVRAIKENTPIIISGRQGRTGKTYSKDYLNKFGIIAYELWECELIELDKFTV